MRPTRRLMFSICTLRRSVCWTLDSLLLATRSTNQFIPSRTTGSPGMMTLFICTWVSCWGVGWASAFAAFSGLGAFGAAAGTAAGASVSGVGREDMEGFSLTGSEELNWLTVAP